MCRPSHLQAPGEAQCWDSRTTAPCSCPVPPQGHSSPAQTHSSRGLALPPGLWEFPGPSAPLPGPPGPRAQDRSAPRGRPSQSGRGWGPAPGAAPSGPQAGPGPGSHRRAVQRERHRALQRGGRAGGARHSLPGERGGGTRAPSHPRPARPGPARPTSARHRHDAAALRAGASTARHRERAGGGEGREG